MRDEWVAPMVLEFANREKFFRLLHGGNSSFLESTCLLKHTGRYGHHLAFFAPNFIVTGAGKSSTLSTITRKGMKKTGNGFGFIY
jgi:hypothetical protein